MKKNLQHLDSKNHEFCALNPASAGCARLGDMARDLDSGGKADQRATRMSRVRVDVASTDLRAQDRPRQTPVHIAHCPIQIMPNLTHLSIWIILKPFHGLKGPLLESFKHDKEVLDQIHYPLAKCSIPSASFCWSFKSKRQRKWIHLETWKHFSKNRRQLATG